MQLGFIGLGNMGFPIARRLVEAHYSVVAYDTRSESLDRLEALGAQAASSARDVADRADTVMASLPSPQVSLAVATGARGVVEGSRVKRFVDMSTVGSSTAVHIHGVLAAVGIAAIDSPISGGVRGAQQGTLAVMVSAPSTEFQLLKPVFEVIGRPIYVGDQPGSAQTMKLANNLLSAAALALTSEAVVMGVKAGLDPAVMIEVLNAGSGATSASRDKFPRSILPRSFDYGFATGLTVKDVRLYLQEAHELGVSTEIAAAVGRIWEKTIDQLGPESDFTAVIRPIEEAAGVVVASSESK
jgi:3-hydroxyisobutyrate dehydrogenase-like beta-hydroxyacid dehydrogenase